MSRLKAIALVAGIALLAWLIVQSGAGLLVAYLERVGWWIFLLLAIAAVRHALRTFAVQRAMGTEHARFSFPAMYGLVLVSEAIGFVTFAGMIFGASSAAVMMRRRVSAVRAVSSVVLDLLLYNFTAAVFALGGIALVFAFFPESPAVRRMGTAGALLLLAAIIVGAVAFTRRWIRAQHFLGVLGRLRLVPALSSEEWKRERAARFAEIDDRVFHFYRRHRRAFYGILALDFAAHFTAAFEVMVILRLLGLPAHYLDGVATEALTKLVQLGALVVPGDVGLYQGGSGLILASLGFTLAAGVALGIVRQVRSILWAALGFLVLVFWREKDHGAAAPF